MPDLTPVPPTTEYVIFYPGPLADTSTHATVQKLIEHIEYLRLRHPDRSWRICKATTTFEEVDVDGLLAGQVPTQRGKRART